MKDNAKLRCRLMLAYPEVVEAPRLRTWTS